MPEGHLLHRYADAMSRDLTGSRVRAVSPQGRFDAAAVDARVLEAVQAHGKHLLHRFEGGPVVHVHLGMRGLYLRHDDAGVAPRSGVRLRLAATAAWDLVAPSTCVLLDDNGVVRLLERLGPDPLRDDADGEDAVRRLRAFPGPVAAALLDQAVWAGVGNAWRAELLHLAGLEPGRPCSSLTPEQAWWLWSSTCRLMALGRDAGQVVSDPAAPDQRWVYKRESCRSCGAPVRTAQLGGRTTYWCPVEQPAA